MRRHTDQKIAKCSIALITKLNNCTKLNWYSLKFNTENESFIDFFNPQYAKQGTLELYYDFFKNICDADMYGELEVETGSLYLALWEENLKDVSLSEKRDQCKALRPRDCTDKLYANAIDNFPRM